MKKNIKTPATKNTSNKTAIKGDPKKANKALIDEYASEMLLRNIFSDDVRKCHSAAMLGPNELAYFEANRKKQEKEERIKHKNDVKLYTLSMVTISHDPADNHGEVWCSETEVHSTKENAIGSISKAIKEWVGVTPKFNKKGIATKVAKHGEFTIDTTGNLSGDSNHNGYLYAVCKWGNKQEMTTYFFIDSTWLPKSELKAGWRQ